MPLPPCTLLAEASELDVGRGVAIVDVETRVASSPRGCSLDLRGMLLAREEGRAPPELVVFVADTPDRSVAGGPRAPVIVDVPAAGGRARVRAVLRGDRFAAVPVAIDPALVRRSVSFRMRARSVFGVHGIAGTARWIDAGVPVLIASDPTRDHEPLALVGRVGGRVPMGVFIVDGGPAHDTEPTAITAEERAADLRSGGARALSVLLSDAPLSVATAENPTAVGDRLEECARLALAASRSADPLLAAVGQRLASAISTGFQTCARPPGFPEPWPALRRDLTNSGILDDASAGCPTVASLASANHPQLRLATDGTAALVRALGAHDLPTISALSSAKPPLGTPVRGANRGRFRGRASALLVALLVTLAVALAAWRLFAPRPAR